MSALRRFWWLPLVGLAAVLGARDAHADVGDITLFAQAGRTLLSSHWRDAYADSSVQSGPLQLLGFGLLSWPPRMVTAIVVEAGVVALLVAVVGRVVPAPRREARIGAGLVALALMLPRDAYEYGHPAELVIPLLWVLAGLELRRARTTRAGLLVALSAGLEVWGVLGIAFIALGRRGRRATAIAAGVTLVLFAPFLVFGTFRMFQYHWAVATGTPLSLLVPAGHPFSWLLRLVQGAAAALTGAAVAARSRSSLHAVWLAPLSLVAVRILLDPIWNPWYMIALQTLGIVGASALLVSDRVLALVRPAEL